jgi:hypothetical protein
MVVHIFAVENTVIWIGNTTIDNEDSQMKLNDARLISYNTHSSKGVLVSSVQVDPALNYTY